MRTAWGYPLDIPIHNRRKIILRLQRVNENCDETFGFHKHETFKKWEKKA